MKTIQLVKAWLVAGETITEGTGFLIPQIHNGSYIENNKKLFTQDSKLFYSNDWYHHIYFNKTEAVNKLQRNKEEHIKYYTQQIKDAEQKLKILVS